MVDLLLQNPYQKIYAEVHLHRNTGHKAYAQNIIRHLGFMYNTFGSAIKDFVKVLSNNLGNTLQKPTQIGVKLTKNGRKRQQKSEESNYSKDNKPTQNERQSSLLNQENQLKKKQIKKKNNFQVESSRINDSSFEWQSQTNLKAHQNNCLPQKQQKRGGQEKSIAYFQSQFIKAPQKQNVSLKRESNYVKFDLLSYKPKQGKINNQTQTPQEIQVIQIARGSQNSEDDYLGWFKSDQNVRVTGGRKKKDRQKLKGITCIQCQKYYKVMKLDGYTQDMCNCTSRHRSNRPTKNLKQQFTQQFDL